MRTTVQTGMLDRFAARLVYRTRKRRGGIGRQLLRVLGVDIPPQVVVGPGLVLPHVGAGHTVHWNTTIGRNVIVNPGVVIGRADLWGPADRPARFVIGDDVVIGANAVVMGTGGIPLTIGDGAVIGAGAVLTTSAGAGEIWAGNPARLIRRVAEPPRGQETGQDLLRTGYRTSR